MTSSRRLRHARAGDRQDGDRRPWETCMTICQQWAWKPNDPLKSLKECCRRWSRWSAATATCCSTWGRCPTAASNPAKSNGSRRWASGWPSTARASTGRAADRSASRLGRHHLQRQRIYLHILDPRADTRETAAIEKKIVGHRVLTGGTATVRQTRRASRSPCPKPTDRRSTRLSS